MVHPREKVVAELVDRYRATEDAELRDELFPQIAEWLIPLILSTVTQYRWDLSLNDSPASLVNEVVTKLPAILLKWKPEKGSFYSYFMSGVFNCFRHIYAKRVRLAKYQGEWPKDESGKEMEVTDNRTTSLTGQNTTAAIRDYEFERLRLLIPQELAALVNEEEAGIVHYIAVRYLDRADNGETLQYARLNKEVAALPVAKSLNEQEIDSLIRMVIAGVRARLYELHSSRMEAETSEETIRKLLRGSPRL